ncbi:Ubiquinone/menaquinone biosynthesis C-methyltransferase UbiE [Candidatus Cyrtobacter comes]|uniref:Ubiquinone/menaquinone biosynthesis C-methyltransferase UbiE n=1 Tax=Candidatus Cyrtobacter comes TaxID=675776 RepID=A0ABU5L8P3_9RICK|nr:class I SAM-dependent methyltransferase [Candidatus Cyrtobacter comes]MDZ5762290.1 Ubiquinone/menaquinone biosynthesis C-methyltransferase UbiE [Candidatus Cyrtobacter comes]
MSREKFIQSVFTNVADKYDLMNDLMSFGIHRIWKKKFVSHIPQDSHISLIDVAGGTCDITKLFLKKNNLPQNVVVCDKNASMLKIGKAKLIDQGIMPKHNVSFIEADAQEMPFDDNSFDCYVVAFGIRNMPNISKVLSEAYRILKPCGKFLCLEFSNVNNPVTFSLYDFYSRNIIPNIGHFIAGSKESYEYLVDSIRTFPDADSFLEMINMAGFKLSKYIKMTSGIVAVHWGYK